MLRTLACAVALAALSMPAVARAATPAPHMMGHDHMMSSHMSGSMSKNHMKGSTSKDHMKGSMSKDHMKGDHMGSSMMHGTPAPH